MISPIDLRTARPAPLVVGDACPMCDGKGREPSKDVSFQSVRCGSCRGTGKLQSGTNTAAIYMEV